MMASSKSSFDKTKLYSRTVNLSDEREMQIFQSEIGDVGCVVWDSAIVMAKFYEHILLQYGSVLNNPEDQTDNCLNSCQYQSHQEYHSRSCAVPYTSTKFPNVKLLADTKQDIHIETDDGTDKQICEANVSSCQGGEHATLLRDNVLSSLITRSIHGEKYEGNTQLVKHGNGQHGHGGCVHSMPGSPCLTVDANRTRQPIHVDGDDKWDAIFSRILCNHKSGISYELGAGTGYVGLIAAALGGNVVITDLPELTDLLEYNIGINLSTVSSCGGTIRAESLVWGTDLPVSKRADIILIADCIYYEESILPLIKTMTDLATETTIIVCCDEERQSADKVRVRNQFFTEVSKFFEVLEVPLSRQHPEYQSSDIHINIFLHKASF